MRYDLLFNLSLLVLGTESRVTTDGTNCSEQLCTTGAHVMFLYLMRHGSALSTLEDPLRPLTHTGTQQVERVAQFINHHTPQPSEIWHSGKLRAQQTAQIISQTLGFTSDPQRYHALEPNEAIEIIFDQIVEHPNILLVGHLPHLQRLTAALVVGNADKEVVAFEPATWVRLKMLGHGNWVIDLVLNLS